jgi:hypothetical protein
MKSTDFIKLLLIINGYDRNISVEVDKAKTDVTCVNYHIYAEDNEGNYIQFDEQTLSCTLYVLMEFFKNHPHEQPTEYIGIPTSDLLSEDRRRLIRRNNDEILKNSEDFSISNICKTVKFF